MKDEKPCGCLRTRVYDSRMRGHMRWRRHKCEECGRRWTSRRPGADTRHKGPASVYFIRAGELIKIGRAKNTERRIKTLQCAAPEKLELIYEARYETAAEAIQQEQSFHKAFKDARVRGEWFMETPAITSHIAHLKQSSRGMCTNQ
jgi:hypothetical protein